MNVLVTGGAGYIGSHTVKRLATAGYRVTILDNLSRGHREAIALLPKAEFVIGDTGDYELVSRVLKTRTIQAVLHFAAHSQVGESVTNPALYYENNVINGLRLLEAVRGSGVPYFIFSSTAAVYGEPTGIPIYENAVLAPTNPYGATKLAFERALQWYSAAYGFKYIALRYFNAAGADPEGRLGEDHRPETHLIPLVLQTALGTRPEINIFGQDYPTPDGTCLRDYIHVTDLAEAHLLALKALEGGSPSQVYNLGNEKGYSVKEVINAAKKVTGVDFTAKHGPRRAGDPAVLVASSRRIQEELGWKPQFGDLETIIRTAWEWHRVHPRGYSTSKSKM